MVHRFAGWFFFLAWTRSNLADRVSVPLSTLLWLTLLIALIPLRALAADGKTAESKELQQIRRELKRLEKKVDRLEERNSELENTNQRLEATTKRLEMTNKQLQSSSQSFETQTAEQVKALETKVESGPSPSALQNALSGFWGDNRFVLAGDFAVDYKWKRPRPQEHALPSAGST
jgi:septal ring factor EnvC (AmiA/AmiB activator)